MVVGGLGDKESREGWLVLTAPVKHDHWNSKIPAAERGHDGHLSGYDGNSSTEWPRVNTPWPTRRFPCDT